MVIVQLSGGLGNQMFEYALYLESEGEGEGRENRRYHLL